MICWSFYLWVILTHAICQRLTYFVTIEHFKNVYEGVGGRETKDLKKDTQTHQDQSHDMQQVMNLSSKLESFLNVCFTVIIPTELRSLLLVLDSFLDVGWDSSGKKDPTTLRQPHTVYSVITDHSRRQNT